MEKRYGKRYEGKIVEIACGKHRWRRGTGSAMENNHGNSLRKASVEERNGKRYGGNIVEIACEKHRWRRAAGRDGRCGWGRGWEVEGARWRKNRGSSLRKAAVEKRCGKRQTLRSGNTLGKVEGALWRKNRGNSSRKACVEKRYGKRNM